jgi:hypothetical protein
VKPAHPRPPAQPRPAPQQLPPTAGQSDHLAGVPRLSDALVGIAALLNNGQVRLTPGAQHQPRLAGTLGPCAFWKCKCGFELVQFNGDGRYRLRDEINWTTGWKAMPQPIQPEE